MGKTKNKESREEEFHRGIIKALRKEIKRLNQRIKQLERFPREEKIKEDKRPVKIYNLCTDCGKGELTISDIGIRRYEICRTCGYRNRIND